MSATDSVPYDGVDRRIIPFNPPGTFVPGTIMPAQPNPPYPLPEQESEPALPFDESGDDVLPRSPPYGASPVLPPQQAVTHPRSVSEPERSDDVDTLIANYRRAMDAERDRMRRAVEAIARDDPYDQGSSPPQVQVVTAFPQASVAHPRYSSMPAGYGNAEPPKMYSPTAGPGSPTGWHPQSPTSSSRLSTLVNTPQVAYNPYASFPATQVPNPIALQQVAYMPPQPIVVPPRLKNEPVPPYPGEIPPPLPTQPTVKIRNTGDVYTKDALLNTNGDALYRFLLDRLPEPPKFRLHCYGSHNVTTTRVYNNRVETVTTAIVDFDFIIDLALSLQLGPGQLYVLDNNVAAYRGGMTQQLGDPTSPLHTVHDWARDYAASTKSGKEFRFRKIVTGIDREKIIDAVGQIISSAGHTTHRNVYFENSHSLVRVRTDSALMLMLGNGCINCLLACICIAPFIWLYRRFSSQGGKWDVCRASYACHRDPRDPQGVMGVPLGEGDWIKIWERTIRLAVGNRIQSTKAIWRPTPNDSGVVTFD